MSERIQVLAQQIFGKASLQECDLQEIKELAQRYPYFSPAQFLLLEKLKQENAPGYAAQLQKSVLYYHDPVEFQYFISPDRFYSELDPEKNIGYPPISHEVIEEKTFQPAVLTEKEIVNETARFETSGEEEIAASIEKVLVQEEKQAEALPLKDDLIFEPYHTVDYFASQGIKLSQEDVSKDKFGRQLKSFTEWLKTMKRLPVTELSKRMDASSETNVQHLADDSVHDSDIVTEAMAEVWIKQGNKQKAIETYNKLGLLNPSKKAYFADLIENLKRS